MAPDLSESSLRSKRRYRRIFYSAGTGALARGFGMALALVTVPLVLGYLGQERYGMWLTMTSMVGLLTFTDLGIGNGLVNALAEADGTGQQDAARSYIASAVAALAMIAVVLGAIFAVAYRFISWEALFNVETPQAAAEAGPAVAVLVAAFLVALPLSAVSRIRAGLQEGFIDSPWTILGSIASLGAVLACITARVGLPWLAFAISGVPLLAVLGNGFSLFRREHPLLRLRIGSVTGRAVRKVMGVGAYFFILQTAAALAYQSDSVIIARIMGSISVPQYAVPMKLFLTIPMLLSFGLIPMWPAYREALSRGDHDWIRVAFRRSVGLSVGVSMPLAAGLTLFGRPLVHLWVGDGIDPTPLLLIGLGAWSVVAAVGGTASTFLNAMGVLRPQAISAVVMVSANVALSIWLTKLLGVSGVVYGSLLAQFAFVGLPVLYLVRREFRRLGPGAHVREAVT